MSSASVPPANSTTSNPGGTRRPHWTDPPGGGAAAASTRGRARAGARVGMSGLVGKQEAPGGACLRTRRAAPAALPRRAAVGLHQLADGPAQQRLAAERHAQRPQLARVDLVPGAAVKVGDLARAARQL